MVKQGNAIVFSLTLSFSIRMNSRNFHLFIKSDALKHLLMLVHFDAKDSWRIQVFFAADTDDDATATRIFR